MLKPSNIEGCKTRPNTCISKAPYAYIIQLDTYTKKVILKAEEGLVQNNLKLNGFTFAAGIRPKIPFSSLSYWPELDTSPLCDLHQGRYFRSLLGTLRWLTGLGRVDIRYQVSSLSDFLARPRTGHLIQTLHIFKYLEMHVQNELLFTPYMGITYAREI